VLKRFYHVDETSGAALSRQVGGMAGLAGQACARDAVGPTSRPVISQTFLDRRFGPAITCAAISPAMEALFAAVQHNPRVLNHLLHAKRSHGPVYRHALATATLMIALARQLGLPKLAVQTAGLAGLLLDIGLGLLPAGQDHASAAFLSLPPRLLDQHVLRGHDCLTRDPRISDAVARVCLLHHERMDGSGYPHGLHAPDIDLYSRMAAVCDAFDTGCCGGSDGVARDPAAALDRLHAEASGFDAAILHQFTAMMQTVPARSGRA
jgi:HD-GYP domain-containing protein (c-di-GMP phosphodiesterase class II)